MNKDDRKEIFEHFVDDMQKLSKSMLRDKNFQLNDLPFGQRAALFAIALHEQLPVKTLAAELQITSGAATQHADALVAAGLVERYEDPADRRMVHLILSKAGRKRLQAIKKQRVQSMEKMFEHISDSDLQKFVSIMQKISDGIAVDGK